MTLPGVTQRRPELGALPNPAGQRGPSALAASGAPAGCAPGPRPAPGPRTLIFVLGTLLLVSRRRGSWLGKARLVAGREQGEGTRPGACPGHQRPGHVQADRTVGRVRRRRGVPGPAAPTWTERAKSPRSACGSLAGLATAGGPRGEFQNSGGTRVKLETPEQAQGAIEILAFFSFFLFTFFTQI